MSDIMNDHIDIYFKQISPVRCFVDNKEVTIINQLHARINLPAKSGIRTLTLQLITPGRIEVADVVINNSSVRHLLYLSWTNDNDCYFQPCTALWETNQIWNLPFGTPISWWIDCVLSKIPQHLFGSDLTQHWDIWYPDRIELPAHFPPVVRDFFATDFSFTARQHTATHRMGLPVQELAIDTRSLTDIAEKAQDLFSSGKFDFVTTQNFAQDQYNQRDDPNWISSQWKICKLLKWNTDTCAAEPTMPTSLFPEFFSWISQFSHVHHAQINFLMPGGYIAPHRDFGENDAGPNPAPPGCNQCYIPLQWEPGSYLKLAGVGILDVGQRAWVINNAEFTHSVVNNSQTIRSVLIIRADMQYNKHLLKEI